MKEKITTGANDRPKHESIAQTAEGLPDDSGAIIDVARDGTAKQRNDEDPAPGQSGAAVADEDPDDSPMDKSPARNKDRQRDQPYDNPGPNDDTYD